MERISKSKKLDLRIRFKILAPFLSDILIKRAISAWGDESKIYDKYVKRIKELIQSQRRSND